MPAPLGEVENWPCSATILAVQGNGFRGRKPVHKAYYYVTSLRTTTHALLQHVRDH